MVSVPLAIVVALDDEIRTINSKMEVDSRVHVRPALFTAGNYSGRPLLVVRSGIGRAAMRSAVAYLFNHYRPSFCLHVGYCGGADPKDEAGDLIIAREVVDAASGDRIGADSDLVARAEKLAREKGLKARSGALVTVEGVVEMPHEKAFVGTQHDASGIDMESADFAAACSGSGVSWLVVRSVLDPLDASLPDMGDSVTAEGATDGMALAEHLIKKPKDLWRLPRLQYFAGQARNSINAFVDAWVEKGGT